MENSWPSAEPRKTLRGGEKEVFPPANELQRNSPAVVCILHLVNAGGMHLDFHLPSPFLLAYSCGLHCHNNVPKCS